MLTSAISEMEMLKWRRQPQTTIQITDKDNFAFLPILPLLLTFFPFYPVLFFLLHVITIIILWCTHIRTLNEVYNLSCLCFVHQSHKCLRCTYTHVSLGSLHVRNEYIHMCYRHCFTSFTSLLSEILYSSVALCRLPSWVHERKPSLTIFNASRVI